MPTEAECQDLRLVLEQSLGPIPAATLMELLPSVGWGDVARRADLEAHARALRGDMAELRGDIKSDMAELRVELKGEMAALRVELTTNMAELRVELKGEMAALSARVDRLVPRVVLANLPIVFGVAGLVLAATKLG